MYKDQYKNFYEIYYFPITKIACTSIKSQYLYEESIKKMKQLLKSDPDVQTILNGDIWYKIYIQETNNSEYSNVFDYIKSLDFLNLTGEKLSMNINMIVKYDYHHPTIIYNFDNNIDETLFTQLLRSEQMLVDDLKQLTGE